MSRRWARARPAGTWLRRAALVGVLSALALGLGNREAPAAQRLPELDVLVAIDRTTSMSALDDPTGSRITAARRDLVALSEHLATARFSVVTFGRSADVRLPFTSDREAFADEVGSTQVENPDAGSGSSVGRAVPLLVAELERAADADRDRLPVVVFVSDGENTSEEEQASFTEVGDRVRAAAVLGYGTAEGGVMPLERVDVDQQPPTPDQAGAVVTIQETGRPARSRLDADNLQRIASELDAVWVPCDGGQDMAAVAAALERVAYADLEPGEPERELRWAWALLLLVLVLPELREGWRRYLEARREGRT